MEHLRSLTEKAFHLLTELLVFLDNQGEANWRRGIKAAITELTDTDGKIDPAGFENARSHYNFMARIGMGGFSEYYVHRDDYDERVQINQKLDDLRTEIWKVFNP